ncbi:MAG: hypothetical protein ABJC60_10180 [Actinomycetota bacterium]
MNAHDELLDRAMDLFPAPAGALQRVAARHRVVERHRRLRAGVLASAIALALVVFAMLSVRSERHRVPGRPSQFPPAATAYIPAMRNAPTHAIVVVGLDGEVRRGIPNLPDDVFAPSMSPDGSRLAFVTSGSAGPRIATSYKDGSELTMIDTPVAANSPVWSPDGSRIAFVGWIAGADGEMASANRDIYIMRADGSQLRRLTTSLSDDETPEWSPDGTSLAYASNPSSDEFSDEVEIWSVSVAGGEPTRLTENRVWDAEPTWSPDGRRIAFYSFEDGRIWVMNADGSEPRPLSRDPGFFAPQWSPDGSLIAGLGGERSDNLLSVQVLDVATGRVRTVGSIGVHSDWNRVRWLPSGTTLLVNAVDV